jgi:hypothetical protein
MLINIAQVFTALTELPLLQVAVETDVLYLKLLIALIAIFALYQQINILGTVL